LFDWILPYLEQFQYIGIALVLFLAGLGVPIPEDIPLIIGGILSGQGSMNVYIHFVVSMVFIIIGDVSLYLIGGRLARNTHTDTPSRFRKILTPKRQEKVQHAFDQYGSWAVFFGRFVAGIRGAVYLTAGMTKFPLGRFIILDFLAALISVPLWIALGYWAGKEWEKYVEQIKEYQIYVFTGLGCVIILFFVWRKIKNKK
jgi:membrane protein DedA with SNARE-associated domain